MLSSLLADLRGAVRALVHARGFTAIALLTLGAGLALSISVLRVGNAYLIRALPYPAADRLYSVRYAQPGRNAPSGMQTLVWSGLDDVIEHAIGWDLDMFYLMGGAYAESAPGAWVTPGFMTGLGIRSAIGRGLGAPDFQAGSPQVAMISHRLWQTRFGGDVAVLGQGFRAYVSDRPDEAETFTIVGVLPEGFWHLNPYTEILVPLRAPSVPYLVRLRDGVSPATAADRITKLVRSGARAVPADWHAALVSTHASYVAVVRPMLLAVGAASGLVLLIACANVAVLLLVRASRRQKEIAVRMALGASEGRMARLLALEGIVLGLAATAMGVFVSRFVMGQLAAVVERQLGRSVPGGASGFALDATVLAGAIACGLITTLVCILAPLVALRRTSLAPALSAGGRSATEGAGALRWRGLLIGIEVAACLTLLTGSALMIESALRRLRVDFGVRTDDVLAANLGLRQRSYPDPASRAALYERLLARLEQVVGHAPVSMTDWWPLQPPPRRAIEVDGPSGAVTAQGGVLGVSAGYFETLGIAILDGRAFTRQDRLGTEPVAIVSGTLARRLWPGGRAVGQHLRMAADLEPEAAPPWSNVVIVGVARDVRQSHTDDDLSDIYVPMLQDPGRFVWIHLRAPGAVARWERELGSAVAAVDAEVSVGALRPLQSAIDQQRAQPRFLAMLLTGFAAFAGLLALVGMYGVIGYAVRQREREIAVRMAIGADRASVTRLFLSQGGRILLAGLLAGLAGAAAIGRLLESQLHGVRPGEPRVLAATVMGLGVCGLLAMWWPARRAAATDPAMALKVE